MSPPTSSNTTTSCSSSSYCITTVTTSTTNNNNNKGPYYATCTRSTNTCTCESDVGWFNWPLCDPTNDISPEAILALVIPIIIIIIGSLFFVKTLVTVALLSDMQADAVTPGYALAWISIILTSMIAILFLVRLFQPNVLIFPIQEAFRLGSLVVLLGLVLHMGLSLLRISTVVRMRYSIEPYMLAIISIICMTICFALLNGFESYFGSLILELSFTFLGAIYFSYGMTMLARRLSQQLISSISNELPSICEILTCLIPMAVGYEKPLYDLFGVTMIEAEDLVQHIYRRQSKRESKAGSRRSSKEEGGGGGSRRSSKDEAGSKHSRESSRESKDSKEESKESIDNNNNNNHPTSNHNTTTTTTNVSESKSFREKRNARKSIRTLFFGEPSLQRTGSKVMLSKGLADRRRDVLMFFIRTTRMAIWVVLFMLGRIASTCLIFALPEYRWLGRSLETGFQICFALTLLAYLDDVYVKRLNKARKTIERARKASKIAQQYMEELEKKVNQDLKISVAPWLIQDDSMATNFDPKMVKTSTLGTTSTTTTTGAGRKSNLNATMLPQSNKHGKAGSSLNPNTMTNNRGSTLSNSGGVLASLMSIGRASNLSVKSSGSPRNSDLSGGQSPASSNLQNNNTTTTAMMQRATSDLDRSPIFRVEARTAVDPDLYVPPT
jgi:hypothetical protein